MLRLGGLDGADDDGMPWVNRLVDAVRESTGLEHGVALPTWDALACGGYPTLAALARDAAQGAVKFRVPKVPTPPRPGTRPAPRWPRGSPPSTGGAPSAPR